MSHTVEVKTAVKDLETARRACRRLNWDEPHVGASFLYDGTITNGIQVRPRGWFFSICADQRTGQLRYDNYVPSLDSRECDGMTIRKAADAVESGYRGGYLLPSEIAAGKMVADVSKFVDAYNAEAAIAAAQAEGWTVEEHATEAGGIELTLSR